MHNYINNFRRSSSFAIQRLSFLTLTFLLITLSLLNSKQAFAEGDVLCSGVVSGTANHDNVNGGSTYFDQDQLMDLSVLYGGTPTQGYAPSRQLAACVEEPDNEPVVSLAADEYVMRGYAFNDNLGFVSMYCGNGLNEGASCGAFDYAVKIGAENAGIRELSGYAWNQSFGYISMRGTGNTTEVSAVERIVLPNTEVIALGADNYSVTLFDLDWDGSAWYSEVTIGGVTQTLYEGDTFTYPNGVTAEIVQLSGSFAIAADNWIDIQLSQDGGTFDYGVEMDSNGDLSGHAYTESGVYLDFNGVNVLLPGEEPVVIGSECDGVAGVCVEINNVYEGVGVLDQQVSSDEMIANGSEGFEISVYLRDGSNNPIVPPTMSVEEFFAENIFFVWEDTVKINQLAGNVADERLSIDDAEAFIINDPNNFRDVADRPTDWQKIISFAEKPWASRLGAVIQKPVFGFKYADRLGDGVEVVPDPDVPGKYNFVVPVQSWGPTYEANRSPSDAVQGGSQQYNEDFQYKVHSEPIERNRLVLKRIVHNFYGKKTNAVIYPNNDPNGKAFLFRPWFYVDSLFADGDKTIIDAFREIPVIFSVKASTLNRYIPPFKTKLGETIDPTPDYQDEVERTANVTLNLAYDLEETRRACRDEEFEGIPESEFDVAAADFIFYFIQLFGGEVGDPTTVSVTNSLEALKQLSELAGFAEINNDAEQKCRVVRGPTLYSVVDFEAEGKTVQYYSMMLPRSLTSQIASPVARFFGKVSSQGLKNIGGFDIEENQVDILTIRSNVDRVVRRTVNSLKELNTNGECVLTRINANNNTQGFQLEPGSGGSCNDAYFHTFTVPNNSGDVERVLYTNSNLTWAVRDAQSPNEELSENIRIIVDGANFYVNENIYFRNKDEPLGEGEVDQNLFLVVLADPGVDSLASSGNVYVRSSADPNLAVTNMQLSAFIDGSMIPYVTREKISETGEPVWDSFEQKTNTLSSCQFYFEGSLYNAKNTIGGSSAEVLFDGYGRTYEEKSLENIEKVQNYDLNAWRFFSLQLQTVTTEDGLVRTVDQSCALATTPDQQAQIAATKEKERLGEPLQPGDLLCGERLPCDPNATVRSPNHCDNFDYVQYDPATGVGDLTFPENSCMAEGLSEDIPDATVFKSRIAPSTFLLESNFSGVNPR